MTFKHSFYDYTLLGTTKNSKGQRRLNRRAKIASIGLYLLFISMAVAAALVVSR